MESADVPSLLGLPAEVIYHVLVYCSPFELTNVALVNHRLKAQAYDDRLWQAHINDNLPKPLSTPKPFSSFRSLFIAHHPHWFLPRNQFWFSDSKPHGKLLFSRYNADAGSIEAHTITARKGQRTWEFWEKDSEVMIHNFTPTVSLDLTRPVLMLDVNNVKTDDAPQQNPSDQNRSPSTRYSKEILMEKFADDGLYESFMLCRSLPEEAIGENTQVWPPQRFFADSRTRNESQDGFKSVGHRPNKFDEVSESTFRLRKWVEYSGRRTNPSNMSFTSSANGLAAAFGINSSSSPSRSEPSTMTIRVPEDITTYASLPPALYTPTPEKPWQGIWCGDYSGHGCEFLLVTQPDKDQERPLPSGLSWLQPWFAGEGRRDSLGSNISTSTQGETDYSGAPKASESSSDESANADDEDDEEPIDEGFQVPSDPFEGSSQRVPDNFADNPHEPTGRLEAIKLTGDPNIPRGEYTFIAPDIGRGGLMRVADEPIFRGARVVRSAGHMAGRGFREDSYTPSQLIMISHDTLAQFWEGFGHISYFRRVNLEELSRAYK
ncbi:Hypothetical protein R9X50_00086500 [Acrodontium crateriforme]|uniref:F-box domain-containing protein n=1 Tax=Acrodontium crateriforme TaxID=150365 RepID=A0AAQ3R7K7_9PEZI|nr:Hypothetical protein R9X50_00086500 [Acrodontium crateriforme]